MKTFKRAISSILAFVMVFSMITVLNVSNTFAATNTAEFYFDGDTATNTNSQIITSVSSTTTLSESATITLANGTSVNATKTLKGNSDFSVSITVTGTAEISVMYKLRSGKSGSAQLKLVPSTGNSTNTAENTSDTNFITHTFSNISSGTYTLSKASGESSVAYIKVVDTVSDSAITYTLSGKTNLNSTEITVGGEKTTTNASGNYTISKTVDGGTAPWTADETLTVTASQYKDGAVTVSAGDTETAFNASDVALELLEFTALKQKEYTGADLAAGLPNFDIAQSYTTAQLTSSNIEGTQVKMLGSFAFKLDSDATVAMVLSSGGSGDCEFNVKDTAGTQYENLTGTVYGSDSTNENKGSALTFTAQLPSGTYIFTGPTSGSKIVVQTITVSAPDTTPTIQLDKTSIELLPGSSETVTATTKNADSATVVWSKQSGSDSISINDSGVITAADDATTADTAVIVATITVDGIDYAANCNVSIRNSYDKVWDFSTNNSAWWENETTAKTITNSANSAVSVDDLVVGFAGDSDNKTINAVLGDSDSAFEGEYYINLAGKSNCYFKYTAPADGTIYYTVANSGNTKNERTVNIGLEGNLTPTTINNWYEDTSTGEYNKYTRSYSLNEGDVFEITGNSNGFYLLGLEFTETGSPLENAARIERTTLGGGDKVVGVYSDDANKAYYAVCMAKASEIDVNDSIALAASDGTEIADTRSTKVYGGGVEINGTTYSVKDFGGTDGDYIYVVKINTSDVEETKTAIVDVIGALKTKLTPTENTTEAETE